MEDLIKSFVELGMCSESLSCCMIKFLYATNTFLLLGCNKPLFLPWRLAALALSASQHPAQGHFEAMDQATMKKLAEQTKGVSFWLWLQGKGTLL